MKNSYVTVTDMFCGAGGSSIGVVRAGAELKLAMNHWKLAIESHAANFASSEHVLTDIRIADPRRYPSTDVLIASPECFVAGTLILAKRGLVAIEDIVIGDEVLTHIGRWRRVREKFSHINTTIVVRGQGHPGLEATRNHPFYTRRQNPKWNNDKRDYDRHVFSDPEWTRAADLMEATCRWATPIAMEPLPVPDVPGRGMSLDNPEFWWLVGRWLGDGTSRSRIDQGGEITIVAGKHEADALEHRLSAWQPAHPGRSGPDELRWRKREIRTAYLFECGHTGMVEWLTAHFGRLAHGKTIPAWALTMAPPLRQALLDGYISADGHRGNRATSVGTVSKRLAIGVRLLVESLGFRAGLNRHPQHATRLEGRLLNVKDVWTVRWENNGSQRAAVADEGHAWSLIKGIETGHEDVPVYNLSIEEDESYVADGIVTHNCTAHTLAKGRKRKDASQMDLWGKSAFDPSEERSRATMWDVPRFAEHHRYNIVIVENVVDACLYWEPFDAWLLAMHSLGYDHELVFLNSMFAHPTPQSRDRLYIVFWRRGNRKPDLQIAPPAWCHQCRQDIQAVQAWKHPHRRRGKYGVRNQYVYRCPTCHEMVLPYYYCAANVIDWSIQGERIGDRRQPLKPKTLKRIRYGLEKFGRQPITMRYDGEKIRPTSEELPTVTTRDAGALVMGLEHGGEAGRVNKVTDPYPTQTGRQDKALVRLPFLLGQQSAAVARPIDEASPTVSTAGAISLLVPAGGTWNEAAKDTREPFPTQTTREMYGLVQAPSPFLLSFYGERHGTRGLGEPMPVVPGWVNHALIGSNRAHNLLRSVRQELHTVVAGGGQHFLLVPYNRTGHARELCEPVGTMRTHDSEGLLEVAPAVEDCYFRMLQPHEIQAAMAFPAEYIVRGTSRDRVKQLGNAVTPPVMSLLFDRCVATLAG